jgi:hypothetical protein
MELAVAISQFPPNKTWKPEFPTGLNRTCGCMVIYVVETLVKIERFRISMELPGAGGNGVSDSIAR